MCGTFGVANCGTFEDESHGVPDLLKLGKKVSRHDPFSFLSSIHTWGSTPGWLPSDRLSDHPGSLKGPKVSSPAAGGSKRRSIGGFSPPSQPSSSASEKTR